MQTRNTSPGRTYRRSQVALGYGILLLGLASVIAVSFDVKVGELFSGVMAGAGAIGALMAAYEAADAAEGSAEAAKHANELTVRQTLPSLFITIRSSTFIDSRFVSTFQWDFIHSLIIDNLGSTYTAATEIKLYAFYDVKKGDPAIIKRRFLLSSNEAVTHVISKAPSELLAIQNMRAYGVEIHTIHGTIHSAIGWVNSKANGVNTQQLGSVPLPSTLPLTPPEFLKA